jgi:hypothetical protein
MSDRSVLEGLADAGSESRATGLSASTPAAGGFTWEDVHTLGEAANFIVYANHERMELALALSHMADRIASLPPRDP